MTRPAWLFLLVTVLSCSIVSDCQVGQRKSASPVEYSNMYVVEAEGDFIGWDIQITSKENGYKVVLFCGEGDGMATIHPENKGCGDVLMLKPNGRGINIKSGDGSGEFVPRRKNFLKQELFK